MLNTKQYIIHSSVFNIFTTQTLISNVPSIFVLAIVPFLFNSNNSFQIGLIFLVYRFGNILGVYISRLISSMKPNVIMFGFELGNILSSIIIILILQSLDRFFTVLIILYFTKGFIGALQSTIRVRWLKQISLNNEALTEKTLITCSSFINASFGIAGLIFMIMPSCKDDISFFFKVDVITSIIGSLLYFYTFSSELNDTKSVKSNNLTIQNNPIIKNLYLVDFFIACGFAGTNILLVEIGEKLLQNFNGYSMALFIYSSCFLVSAFIINKFNVKDIQIPKVSLFFIIFAFLLASLKINSSINLISSILILFFYPCYLLGIEKFWFRTMDTKSSGRIISNRMLMLATIWALGEPVYALIESDFLIRLLFVFLGLVLLFQLKENQKA